MGIERRKKEQQRGGTKEDKSLRGTTIKLVCVIPVIKTKHQSKRTQGNVRSPRVATRQINTAGHHKKRQAPTTERRERRIENRTKNNHTTSKTTTRVTTAASKQ